MRLDFGQQGYFDYQVTNFNFLQNTTEELNQKKMIILIPFALLRLRKAIEKKRSPENLLALQKLIQNDIIGSINENLRVGNISMDDARQLRQLTHRLYNHIYSSYEEMEEINDMTDESLILDIINREREKELAEQAKYYEQKLKEQEEALKREKDEELAKLQEEMIVRKDEELAKLQEEIRFLKMQLKM